MVADAGTVGTAGRRGRPTAPADPSPLRRIPAGAALYLHVPFCAATCDFCAFDKQVPSPGDWQVYREGLEAEWALLAPEGPASSCFWGGGTPGLLKASDIRRIGDRFRRNLQPGAEWTVELTPQCLTREKMEAWREVGVNRLSLGVQSFSPSLLRALGRPHANDRVEAQVDRLRAAGWDNLNLDLIVAVPGQGPRELEEDLRRALALSPDHLSLYNLTLEEDTPLLARLAREGYRVDPENEAGLLEHAWDFLETAGFHHYEVSNFARPGHESRHHRTIWGMGEWRGLGPSAASQVGSYRFRNPHGLEAWRTALREDPPAVEERVELSPAERVLERAVFGLRTSRGFPVEAAAAVPGLEGILRRLEAAEWLRRGGDHWVPTRAGLLVADAIGREILASAGAGAPDFSLPAGAAPGNLQ